MRSSVISRIGMLLVVALMVLAFSGQSLAATYDLGGETVRIGIWDASQKAQFQEGQGKAWLQEVEQMFNCKIEFYQASAWRALMDGLKTEALAGKAVADVLYIQYHWLFQQSVFDFAMPLNEVVEPEYYDRLVQVGMVKPELFEVKGDQLGIPVPGMMNYGGQWCVWNKSLFEREGLPSLYDLVEAGEWTWDKFREFAIALTKDTDGDGVIDQWGIGDSGLVGQGIPWVYTNNAYPYRDIDGRLVYTADQPEFIEAMQFGRELKSLGVEARGVYDSNGVRQLWWSGKVGMMGSTATLEQMEDDWGIVPLPMGPSATGYTVSTAFANAFVVPITATNVRPKLEVVTALYRTAEPYRDTEAYEQELWDNWMEGSGVRDWESVEWMQWMNDNITVYDISMKNVLPGSFSTALADILAGNAQPLAALEAIKPEAQARLDQLFND